MGEVLKPHPFHQMKMFRGRIGRRLLRPVKEITNASKGTPGQGGGGVPIDDSINITGTPRYDWDAGYDGIQGFATQLRNRVSDPSTPQRRLSPRQTDVGGMSSPKRGKQVPNGGVLPAQKPSPKGGRPSPTPATKETTRSTGTTQPETRQPSTSTPRQLLIYDETPTGRPLPTLRDIRQANLRRVLEEEGADTPCDICGTPDHDYRTCPRGSYLESQDPTRSQAVPESPYCGWCQQYGHISANCLARYYDDSMNIHFPPKEKRT